MGADRDRMRGVDPRELLDDERERSASAPAPPYSSGNGTPKRPSSAISRTVSHGNPRLVVLGRDRRDPLPRELAHGLHQQPLLEVRSRFTR